MQYQCMINYVVVVVIIIIIIVIVCYFVTFVALHKLLSCP